MKDISHIPHWMLKYSISLIKLDFSQPRIHELKLKFVYPWHIKNQDQTLQMLMKFFSSHGVKIVKTLVEWDSGDIISYFRSLGFRKGTQIVLEANMSSSEV